MNADDRNKLWDQTYRKEIGETLKVKLPDGRIVPVWQFWQAIVTTPGGPGTAAEMFVTEIGQIFKRDVPEVPEGEHLRRAARMYLMCLSFEVSGHEKDAYDLKVLRLFCENGNRFLRSCLH